MTAISFQTPGLIDPRCITTMGVSIKENDNPIGQFGTGLKYAIAIILAKGGEVSIWRGLEELKFEKREVEIRARVVELVYMNGAELSFTTHLGAHWQMWLAFRELYSNTLDEKGETIDGDAPALEGATTIVVKQAEFARCYAERGQYFLLTKPIYVGDEAEFHPGPSHGIFYRGILVGHQPNEKPHKFAVNVLNKLDLTEDRTLSEYSSVARAVARTICRCKDEEFLISFIGCGRDYAEHTADLDWYTTPSPEFMKVTCRLAERMEPVNSTALKVYRKHAPAPRPVESQLMSHERAMLAGAVAICNALDFPVDEYQITVVDTLGPNTIGKADPEAKEIWLSRQAFLLGDAMVATTLIEEWCHIKHGHQDCTRGMQNWLFDHLFRFGRAYLDLRDRRV